MAHPEQEIKLQKESTKIKIRHDHKQFLQMITQGVIHEVFHDSGIGVEIKSILDSTNQPRNIAMPFTM